MQSLLPVGKVVSERLYHRHNEESSLVPELHIPISQVVVNGIISLGPPQSYIMLELWGIHIPNTAEGRIIMCGHAMEIGMGNKLCAPLLKKSYNTSEYPWHVRKDSHLLRLWAEVFRVHGDGENMRWQRVSDDVVPVNISCIEDNPRTVFHITAYNRYVEKIFDVRIIQPDTVICPATESFVHWRDSNKQCEWGLNFTSPIDARRFRECCSYPTQKFARKATSASSLRLSPPKDVRVRRHHTLPTMFAHQRCHPTTTSVCQPSPQQTVQPPDSQIVAIRKEKSATIPRAQIEQEQQTFKPQGILKPSSDTTSYDKTSSSTTLRKSGAGHNLAFRQSLPPSSNFLDSTAGKANRQSASAAQLLPGRNPTSVNRVSFSSFGKESDRSGPQCACSSQVSDKIQMETAFVGDVAAKPQKRVTVHEPSPKKTQKQVLRVLAPSSTKSQNISRDARKSSSSSSPEWPSPPEPLTPLTPVTPVCNMDFDKSQTTAEQKTNANAKLCDQTSKQIVDKTSNEQTAKPPKSPGVGAAITALPSQNKAPLSTQSKTPVSTQSKAPSSSQSKAPLSSQSKAPSSSQIKASNQKAKDSDVQLRNQSLHENVSRDSYPDSGIGGMTIDTAGSVWSGASSKSAPAKTEVKTANQEAGENSSGESNHGSESQCHSEPVNPLADGSESRQYLASEISDEEGGESDDSLHTMTEADSQIYTQQYGAIRKAGWLVVKNWLVHKKKKLELASKRNWKRYWVCLKGTLLLFYNHNEEHQGSEDSPPRHVLVLEGGIAQAVPEHPKRDNIFSLSTALGDGYLLQAQCQTDLEAWILSIHSACATSLARFHGKDNTLKFLRAELQKLEANIDMDVKMRKMAELQLTVVRDPRSRQAIMKQICQWEENLEKLYIEQLRCYLASLQGSELPNPKVLLANASKTTKTTLGRLGIFTVTSFHALVCARKPLKVPLINGKSNHKTSVASPKKEFLSKHSNNKPKSPTTPTSPCLSKDPAGSLSRIGLPSNQTTLVGVDKRTTVQQLLESVCNKRQLNPEDHYVRVKLPDTPPGVYAVPDKNLTIKQIHYATVDVCQKSVFQIEVTKTESDKDYGMTLEAELGDDLEREDDLKIYISDVRKGGLAERRGLIIGDEILVINRRIVNELDMTSIEMLIQRTQSLLLTIRSLRQRPPPGSFIINDTEKLIEGISCPPPPSQPHLSDQELGQLMVPNPKLNLGKGHRLLTSPKHGLLQKKMKDVQIEDLMKNADQVTAICRTHSSSDCSSICTTSLSDAQKLRKVIMELIDTERAYVKDLNCLTERYLEPLKEETFLTSDEIEQLFGNIQEIVQFQRQFLLSLEEGIQLESEFFTTEDPNLLRDEELR
ncbi:hypothetical protein ScPMuIL_012283, partial [Solemya velum]